MRKYIIFFIFAYFVFTQSVYAATISTTGFIPGQIWYSKDSFVEGDTISIYTAVWNNNSNPLSVKVEFYDNNILLGTRDAIAAYLQLKDISISWKVTPGDHLISAKIISSSINNSGLKQTPNLEYSSTQTDHKFIPVTLTTADGTPATSSILLQSQIDKATSSLNDILPTSVATPVSQNVSTVDNVRSDTLSKINNAKIDTQNKIDSLNKIDTSSTKSDSKKVKSKIVVTKDSNNGLVDATDKPIAYIKLFFLSVLSFIFGSRIVFYLLIFLVVFFIIRGIYRKIKK